MLADKRKELIEYIKKHKNFLATNAKAMDIYDGNLLPYVDKILSSTLSPNYYSTVRHRNMPINILKRFIDKVSTTYSKPPLRSSQDPKAVEFVNYYSQEMEINTSGTIADTYSHLFKGFAWEPYINSKGKPAIRELSFDSFLVYSDSMVAPEDETVFLKFMGSKDGTPENQLIFAYSDEEFDAFYMNGSTASEYLVENQGVNLIGVIPFVYGKRQKNKLIPTLDSDMLAMTEVIPCMLLDASGAQFYQAFSTFYGIDIDFDNARIGPNVVWSLKSDKDSDKTPQVGVLTPTADTEKVVSFVMNCFVLWLETKGVRVGSVGSIDAGNTSSGIAKVIDEMDVWELKKKSQAWFKKDEEELWNEKMPKIHNYWIKSGMLKPDIGLLPENYNPQITVEFEAPSPMVSRSQEIADIKAELDIKTMTLKQAIQKLHPSYNEEQIDEVLNGEQMDESEDTDSEINQASGADTNSKGDSGNNTSEDALRS